MAKPQIPMEGEDAGQERPAGMRPKVVISIRMDSAIYKLMSDGNVVIQRRVAFTWIAAALVALFFFPILFAVLNALLTERGVKWTDWIVPLLIPLSLGLLLYGLVNSALQVPSVFVDRASKTMRIGRASGGRTIPCSRIVEIKTALPPGAAHVSSIGFVAILDDGEVLRLGSVSMSSGEKEKDLLRRARTIMGSAAIAIGLRAL